MGSRKYVSLIVVLVLVLGSFTALFIPGTSSGTKENSSSYQPSSLGMVSYWKLDKNNGTTIKDSRGQNHGRTWGDPKRVEGKVGNALEFDGDEDFAEIADDPSLDTELNESFTLEFWVKRDSIVGSDWDGIIEKPDDNNRSYGVFFNNNDNNIYSAIGDYDNGESVTVVPSGGVDFTFDTWHHVALRYNGTSDKADFFMDGDHKGTENHPKGVFDSSGKLNIGRGSYLGTTEYFDGIVDEIALYNKSLSNTTVHNHYRKSEMGYGYLEEFVWVDDDYDSSTPGWQVDHFDSIQDGIDAVNSSTVYVATGTYNESVVVNKSIDLIGENRQTTTINGNEAERVVEILTDRVNMTGFSVKNGSKRGIHITGDHTNLWKNKVEDIIGEDGSGAGPGNVAYGIYLNSVSNCTINNNIITNIKGGDGGDSGDGGDAFGIYIEYSENNTISSSSLGSINGGLGGAGTASDGDGYGVYLFSSDYNKLIKSDLKKNDYAVLIYNSSDNTFYYNNFINSSAQHIFSYDNSPSNNTWTDFNGTGNYWDDYNGSDNGSNNRTPGDGIGDTEIPHPETDQGGGYNKLDNYPLTRPWPLKSLADAPWPMYGQNLKHTHRSPHNTSHVDGTVKWVYTANDEIHTNPAIAKNGTVYFGHDSGTLVALDKEGNSKWDYNAAGDLPVRSSPAIDKNGTIYFGSDNGEFNALYPNGDLKWSASLGEEVQVQSSPVIGKDGRIFVGANDNRLHAYNQSGVENWTTDNLNDVIKSSPAVGDNGMIYVGTANEELHSIYPNNGTVKWTYTASNGFGYSNDPAIGKNGTIYIRDTGLNLYAINSDGSFNWSLTWGNISAGPAVGEDGTIYFGDDSGNFYAYTPEGTQIWRYPIPGGNVVSSCPSIGANGTIYFGTGGNRLYALNPDGTMRWNSDQVGAPITTDPSIGPKGRVYVGTGNSRLYAFGASYGVEVNAPSDQIETVRNKTYTYDFTVKNTGSANDTYTLNVSDTHASFLVSVPQEVTIPAGESETVTVEVKILENVTIGDSTMVTLNATSQNNETSMDEDVMNLTYENCGVNVTAPSDKVEAFQGTFTYKFWVNNTGSFDETYDLNATSSNPDFVASCQDQVSVPEGAGKQVDVNVTITASASYGENSTVSLNATSQNSSASSVSYSGSPIGSVSTVGEWDQGMYNSTSIDRQDNSGNLGIGYRDGPPGDGLMGYWRFDEHTSMTTVFQDDFESNDWTSPGYPGSWTESGSYICDGTYVSPISESYSGCADTYYSEPWYMYHNIDLSDIGSQIGKVTLDFKERRDNSEVNEDNFYVNISTDGGSTWTNIDNYTGNGGPNHRSYDITSDVASVNSFYLRFEMSSDDDGGYEAFVVDDINVTVYGSVKDYSRNSNHGLIYNDTTSGVNGVDSTTSFYFDGSGDYVEAPHSPSLNLTEDVTISAWINPQTIENWDRFIAKSTSTNDYPWTLYGLLFDDGGHLRMEITNQNGNRVSVNGKTSIPTNQWTHVAGSYDGGEIKIYVNGELDGSAPQSGGIENNTMPLSIGRSGFDGNYFHGRIDEVMVYNRSLSGDEIDNLYQLGGGLVTYYRMDRNISGDGGSVKDYSGNDDTGTTHNETKTGVNGAFSTKGFEFDGTDDYVEAPSGLINNGPFAFSFWFKPSSSTWNGTLLDATINKTSQDEKLFHIIANQSQINWIYEDGNDYNYELTLNADLSQQKWYHVVATGVFNGDGYQSLYLNGHQLSSQYINAGTKPDLQTLHIGNYTDPTTWYMENKTPFSGKMDEFQIYSKDITSEGVEELYHRQGLVGFWKMDDSSVSEDGGTVISHSAFDNVGTTYNGVDTDSTGVFSTNGFGFDGVDDHIAVPDDKSLDISGPTSMQAWIKPNVAHETGSNLGVMAKAESGVGWAWQLRFGNDNANDTLGFKFNTDVGDRWVNVGHNLTPDEWYHVAGVFNGAHAKLYLNGELKDVTTFGSIITSDAELVIGADGWDNYFNGSIDEVRIYNKSLSEAEVKELYSQSKHSGIYESKNFNIPENEAPSKIRVNSTNIDSENETWVNVSTSRGGYDLIKLDEGTNDKNYSLDIPQTGGSATVTFTLASGEPTTTPVISDFTLYSAPHCSDEDSMVVSYENYSVDVGPPPDQQETGTGTYNYTFMVNNTGTYADNYTLTASSSNSGSFQIVGHPNWVYVPAGGSEKVNVSVDIQGPISARESSLISLNATSMNYPSIYDNDSMRVTYGQYNVSVKAPQDQNVTTPGTHSFLFTVNNTGSLNETFDLTVGTSEGWTAHVDPSSVHLLWNESKFVYVNVTVPDSVSANTTCRVTLNASSVHGNATGEDSMNITYQEAIVDVVPPGEQIEFQPGSYLYQFRVNNNGTIDDTYNLSVFSSNNAWSASLLSSSVTIPANDSKMVTVNVTIPTTANPGDYSLIFLNSSSQNWSAYDNDSMKVSYDEYGVNVTAPEDTMKTQTKIYKFKFWVNNTGTLNDTYTLNATSDNPDFTISSYPNIIQVDANEAKEVYINVTISSYVNPGDTANITLMATSNSESEITDQDSMMILYEEYNVSVTAPSDTTKTGPGAYTFQFWINNTGSLNNTYILNVICTNPNWTFTLNSTIWVSAHEREPVNVTVDIPESSPGGITETITLNATGKNGTAVYDEDSMDLTYEKYDLNVAGPSEEVMFIENKTFQFSIENTGSLSDTYNMTVSSNNLDWTVKIVNNKTVTLSPGDTAEVPVKVIAPSTVKGGNFTTVILNGTSGNTEINDLHSMGVTYEDLNVTVNAPSDATVFTRHNHTYQFRVNNTGSLEDTYELTVTTNNSWDASVIDLTVTVPADQGKEVTVNITVPDDAQLGESSRITLKAISQKRAFSQSNDSFVVSYEGYDVDVYAPSDREENSYSTYNYTFTIENTGTVFDTYGLTATSNNSNFAVSVVDQISLAPKNQRPVEVEVTISSDATSGESALIELEVASENSPESSIDSMTVSYVEEKEGIPPTSQADPEGLLPTYKSNESFQIHFECSDNKALNEVALYYRLDQEEWSYWGTVDISGASATGSFTFTAPEDGNYSFYTIATDAAGNSESPPEKADAGVVVDTIGPELSITKPAEGSLRNTSDVEVAWASQDNTSGLSLFEIKMDNETWGDNGLKNQSMFLGLDDGVHQVNVRAVDKAGNIKISRVQFEIDTTPPLLSIRSPDEGESFEDPSVLIDWEGEDNQTSIVRYQLRLDEKDWIDTGTDESYTFSSLSDGSYTVEVTCIDEAGNTQTKEVDFEVTTADGGEGGGEDTLLLRGSCWLGLILIILMAVIVAILFISRRRRREEEPEEAMEKGRLEKEEEGLPPEEAGIEEASEEAEMGETEVSEEGAVPAGVGAVAAEKEEKEEEGVEEVPDIGKLDIVEEFQKLKGVGSGIAHALYEAGYHSMDELEEAEVGDLRDIEGIGFTQAELIYEAIQRGEEGEVKGKKAPQISEEDLKAHQMGPMVKGREMKKEAGEEESPEVKDSDLETQQIDSKVFEGEAEEVEEKELEECPICGASVSAGDEECLACGEPLMEEVEEEGLEKCPVCGTGVPADAEECPACGESMVEEAEEEELEDEAIEEAKEEITKEEVVKEFKQFKGIGSAMADRLYESGFHSLEEIKEASPEELQEVKGIGSAKSEKLYETIQDVES
ncbi:MAG: LamG-like jellyroll fold domain-containing protein [Candidatus Thermoplasmatota archaeon]